MLAFDVQKYVQMFSHKSRKEILSLLFLVSFCLWWRRVCLSRLCLNLVVYELTSQLKVLQGLISTSTKDLSKPGAYLGEMAPMASAEIEST